MNETSWDGDRRALGIALSLFLAAVALAGLGLLALGRSSPDAGVAASPTPSASATRCPLPPAITAVRAVPHPHYVTISWTDPREVPATYRVYRRADPATGWTLLTEVTLIPEAPRRVLDGAPSGAGLPEYAVAVLGVCGESPLER